MLVVWGTKLYGKVDEIEGLGHVATQFGHLFWIPLLPMNSYFVTEQEGWHFEGTPLGLQLKSVLAGYARVFSLLFFLFGLAALNTLYSPHEDLDPEKMGTYKTMIVLGLFSIPMFAASYSRSVRIASFETACLLSQQVGFDKKLRTYIEFCYDQISEAEAEQRLDDIDAGETESSCDDDAELAEYLKRYKTA
ncbi:MAG: hypothetical protein ACR2NM_17225 [Bythopirellula sp.]